VSLLSIVVPVYNEEPTIRELIEAVLAAPLPDGVDREVIVVDDCSTDGTLQALAPFADNPRVRVFKQPVNQGKGAALRAGFGEVRGEFTVVQDADLEYDPGEYPKLLAPVLAGKADVVYGSRFMGGQAHRVLFFWHYLGNRFLTLLSNAVTNLNLTDMETCYKLFRTDVLRRIELRENRFGFEPEVTAKVSRLNVRIYEVGISYWGRTYEEGKKINWRDGVEALLCIVKYGLLRG
jgi:glycosyltransferase involved in cell wall biosynthesis